MLIIGSANLDYIAPAAPLYMCYDQILTLYLIAFTAPVVMNFLLILETVDPYFLLYFTLSFKMVGFYGIYCPIVMRSSIILENADSYSSSFHIYIYSVFFLFLF